MTGLLGSSQTSIDWVVPLIYQAYVRLERPERADGATHVARHVINVLRRVEASAASTPVGETPAGGSLDACWFAVADLYGWNGHDPLPSTPLVRLDDEDAALLRADPAAFFESRTSFGASQGAAMPTPRTEPYPYPLAETGNRSYMLFPGRLEDALILPDADAPTQIPDLWWPADRAWFLGGDTDFPHVFLGGSQTLIDHVVADPALHATRIEPNPAPERPR